VQEDTVAAFERFGLKPPASRPAIPHGAQTIAVLLDEPLRKHRGGEALIDRHSRYSYAELDDAINAGCQALVELGVCRGDRIAASSINSADLVIAFLAAQRLGAVWVGMNRVLAPREKLYLLQDSEAALLLIDQESLGLLAPVLDEAGLNLRVATLNGQPGPDGWRELVSNAAGARRPRIAIDPFAPALISYTSGTTGRPKGAVHSQHNIALLAAAWIARGDWDVGLRRGCAQALTINNMMIRAAVQALAGGGTMICMDRTDAEGVADWIENERIEVLFAVPTMLHDLLMNPKVSDRKFPSLVRPLSGAAKLPENVRVAFRERFGTEVQFAYGLTEAPTAVTQTDPTEPFVPGSSGRAFPHLEIAILDGHREAVAAGEEGEVAIRARQSVPWAGVYTPMLGYWRRPDATAEVLRDGWLLTGDVGRLDDEGRLFIVDRRNDVIIRGGANIYPAEVERAIEEFAGVTAVAVLGLPDERLGQIVAAVIQLADERIDLEQLDAWLRTQLAAYKLPKFFYRVDAMPRNAMNKIVKPQLAERIADGNLTIAFEARARHRSASPAP
jgi:acyl-CoA synthetase (AMP-forming)/AMP-acid ligase II